MPFSQGRIELSLTVARPHRHCTFTNTFDPTPPPAPERPQPVSPEANLVVTKRATSQVVRVGDVVTYEIGVVNRGSGPAAAVTLIDQPLSPATLVSARSDRGSCGDYIPLTCNLGTLKPGAKASLTVRLRPRGSGSFVNHAVANTSTLESEPASAQADASVSEKPVHPSSPPTPGLG